MNTSENVLALHDRATRKETLSAAEQMQLQAWYDDQDQAELVQLGLTTTETGETDLRHNIAGTLERIAEATTQIQSLTEANDALRHENLNLRRQLAEQPLLQAA